MPIRDDVPASELRRLARREPDRNAAARMAAIVGALEGMPRAEPARLAGMERQALRDAAARYNDEGLAGLHDRPRSGRPPRLGAARSAALRRLVLDGPDVETAGLSARTLPGLCREVEARWGAAYHPSHIGKLLRRLGLSRQKARPSHPNADAAAREAFAKGAPGRPRRRARGAPRQAPDALVPGRSAVRPERARLPPPVRPRPPPAGAVRPALHPGAPLRRPTRHRRRLRPLAAARLDGRHERVSLARFGATLGPDEHAAVVLDGAGWHTANGVRVPGNVALVPLPPYAPELNPVERVWPHPRERHLSHRLLDGHDAVVGALCRAWNALTKPRLRSLTSCPYLEQIRI